MKNTFAVILLLSISGLLLSFTGDKNKKTAVLDISGKWNLAIDQSIDGNISGNNGCEIIEFTSKGINNFVGRYSKCAGSNNAKPSQFSGKIYTSNRGNLINIIQDNLSATQYYSSWSGKLFENGEIIGIWTDVVGNQGEFKLTR